MRVDHRAAAQAGKSVLHLDHADGYGSYWKAHTLDSLLEWAALQRLQYADPCRARKTLECVTAAFRIFH